MPSFGAVYPFRRKIGQISHCVLGGGKQTIQSAHLHIGAPKWGKMCTQYTFQVKSIQSYTFWARKFLMFLYPVYTFWRYLGEKYTQYTLLVKSIQVYSRAKIFAQKCTKCTFFVKSIHVYTFWDRKFFEILAFSIHILTKFG